MPQQWQQASRAAVRAGFDPEQSPRVNEVREQRLKVSGKPHQYNDLSVFIREQELMKRLVGESMLPRLELDISDNDIPRAVEKIADWLEATGGLWMGE